MSARVRVGARSATVNAIASQRPHALSAALASVLNAFMAALSVKMPTTCCRGFPIICSGVYLFRLILSSSFKVQNKPDSLNQPGPLFSWRVTTSNFSRISDIGGRLGGV